MIYKPTEDIETRDSRKKSVFLAGSIEQNKAIDWQTKLGERLKGNYNVFNPRRDSWDASWIQSIENKEFKAQVDWELTALEAADIIVMYFQEGTKSPISLLEFGLYAQTKKLLVVCEPHFWRKGNIDIVCERYEIPQFKNLSEIILQLNN